MLFGLFSTQTGRSKPRLVALRYRQYCGYVKCIIPASRVSIRLWKTLSFRMGPSNDHELAIARIVDRIDTDGRLNLASIQEVVDAVDFMMDGSDTEFLVNYVRWRMDHPIVK